MQLVKGFWNLVYHTYGHLTIGLAPGIRVKREVSSGVAGLWEQMYFCVPAL